MQTAKVRMQTQTRSELPGFLICTRSATLTTQRTNTHTLWSFNWKWFTHTWINTSDHRMQILVPHIRLNNPQTIFQAHNSNNILRHRTQISRYQAPMKTLKVMQSPLFTPYLQTTFCCPHLRCNGRSYKLTFSLPDPHSLFYMPLNLRLGPLQILLIPQHHPP
jgi:hypothetical protein